MGKTFENLTWDDLCDLMCGGPEDNEDEDFDNDVDAGNDDRQQISKCKTKTMD